LHVGQLNPNSARIFAQVSLRLGSKARKEEQEVSSYNLHVAEPDYKSARSVTAEAGNGY